MNKIEKPNAISVASFLETGKGLLRMELVAGEKGLDRTINENALNRAGLALTGFFRYFPHRRIQLIGLAEYTYLESITDSDRSSRLREFFGKKIPCVVVTRSKKVLPEVAQLGEEFGVPVLRTAMITKHFVNAATLVMENLTAPRVKVQGTMVEVMGIGVLIQGKPGIGKSETALELIMNGAALVSDDITELRLDSSGAVLGTPINVTRYHMEVKGIGIIHVPSLFGVASVREAKKLDLVVTLCRPEGREEADRQCSEAGKYTMLGVTIPQVTIPVAPGRNVANIVRTAALDQKLRRLGHDATKELDEQLISRMTRGLSASE